MDIDQESHTSPPFLYSFAAVPNLVEKRPDGVYVIGQGFNAGFFVLEPDVSLFNRIWDLAMAPGAPWNTFNDMEQGLLNDFFASGGNVPMHTLHWSWNVKDLGDEIFDEAKVVHSRWWQNDPKLAGPKQVAEWWRTFGQVEGFWESEPENF